MNRELIKDEIQLAENEGCIVFDFGCYFPYSNYEVLTFDFSLGEKKFDDYKINHRYPNRYYQTITKKYGRKVSKLGYPYIVKLGQTIFLLRINVGIKDQYMSLVFPIEVNLTKNKPVCALSLRYNFDKSRFYFVSHEKAEEGGWYRHCWLNYEPEKELYDKDIILSPPSVIGDGQVALYSDVITPLPSKLSDLLIL